MLQAQAARPDRLAANHRRRSRSAVSDPANGDVRSGGELDLRASCRARVDALVDAGAGMGVIERTIEAFALPSEEKAVLCLGAWSRRYPVIDEPCDAVIRGSGPPGPTGQRVVATSSAVLGHD